MIDDRNGDQGIQNRKVSEIPAVRMSKGDIAQLLKERDHFKADNKALLDKLSDYCSKHEKMLRDEALNIEEKIQMQKTIIDNDKQVLKLQLELDRAMKSHSIELENHQLLLNEAEDINITMKSKLEDFEIENIKSVGEIDDFESIIASLQAEISVQSREMQQLENREENLLKQKNDALIMLDKSNVEYEKLHREHLLLHESFNKASFDNKKLEEKLRIFECDFEGNGLHSNHVKDVELVAKLTNENKVLNDALSDLQFQFTQSQDTSQLLNKVLREMSASLTE